MCIKIHKKSDLAVRHFSSNRGDVVNQWVTASIVQRSRPRRNDYILLENCWVCIFHARSVKMLPHNVWRVARVKIGPWFLTITCRPNNAMLQWQPLTESFFIADSCLKVNSIIIGGVDMWKQCCGSSNGPILPGTCLACSRFSVEQYATCLLSFSY